MNAELNKHLIKIGLEPKKLINLSYPSITEPNTYTRYVKQFGTDLLLFP